MVAVFILLIACINFMNLATARSAKRAKEVGIRKTIGAARWTLIAQFIGEAMLLTLFAATAALILVMLLLPVFNNLTEKTNRTSFFIGFLLVKYFRVNIFDRFYFRQLSGIVPVFSSSD